MTDYRVEILKQFNDLIVNWDNHNMLYNSLRFFQLYNGQVEYSELVTRQIEKKPDSRNDIMTSWWTPTKFFLLRNKKGNREELTKLLIESIPSDKSIERLKEPLSRIRYGKDSNRLIDEDVIKVFMEFLGAVYSIGNMTNVAKTSKGGPLDNWDSKLVAIKEKYIPENEWKQYVEENCFQCYFSDEEYKEIKPFWNYGCRELSKAEDIHWKTYFSNVKKRIEEREKLLKKSI